MKKIFFLFLIISCYWTCSVPMDATPISTTEVLVIGEGTGATTAAIQSARSGAKTILVNPISWLGGMLTAAGVSATDGNHQLPAGLWGEFRDSLRQYYGGADSLFTGWVSNTMFEPSVGNYYWQQITHNEPNLTIKYETFFDTLYQKDGLWKVIVHNQKGSQTIQAKIVIDGTDLGDVAAKAGATFDVGMDSRQQTGEKIAPEKANDIIQDLTYAAILKDFGKGTNHTIPQPEGYDPTQFYCACKKNCQDETAQPHPCETMLNYGKLPNGKYMINWPLKGNDYYANIIEKSPTERAKILAKAKNKTLQFVYYIQTALGYEHLGIANEEFPTKDGLPLMPYHREGRRIHGLVQLNLNHILQPYQFNLYRTGIAVGDYPIDHHHFERSDAPEIDFPKVPSFSIPIGALIPENVDNLLMADKAISVTNIVNGSSRLQPVIIQIGQVAGLIGAEAILQNKKPKALNIRQLQEKLLASNGYLMPFIDVKLDHPHFKSIQKIGATGLLRGHGVPYKWANQTWFYPDSTILTNIFLENVKNFDNSIVLRNGNMNLLTIEQTIDFLYQWMAATDHNIYNNKNNFIQKIVTAWHSDWLPIDFKRPILRKELAVLLDKFINPFDKEIEANGAFSATLPNDE